MEIKKRPLTTTACILNLIFGIVGIISSVLILLEASVLGGYYSDLAYLLTVIAVASIVLSLVIIILSIVLLTKKSKPVAEFRRVNGIIITLFIFDALSTLSSLTSINFISLISVAVYATCATFLMIDMVKNNKEHNNMLQNEATSQLMGYQQNQYQAQPYTQTAQNQSQAQQMSSEQTNASSQPTYKNDALEKMKKDLADIQNMKDLGIISEQEYQALKEKVINNAKF